MIAAVYMTLHTNANGYLLLKETMPYLTAVSGVGLSVTQCTFETRQTCSFAKIPCCFSRGSLVPPTECLI